MYAFYSFAQSAYHYLERVAGRAPRDEDTADKRFQTTHVDWENVRQARANIIAGACLGLGFRFAGTADGRAFEVALIPFSRPLSLMTRIQHKPLSLFFAGDFRTTEPICGIAQTGSLPYAQ